MALLLSSIPWLWTTTSARGHLYDEAAAPSADVVIVLGTRVGKDGRPSVRLAGRLETAAALVNSGRARVVLVSGDGGGRSGDEIAAMTAYLTGELGVDPRRVVADPYGLDTYDTCARARDVYGVTRALIVTQSYHLARAVTLCRHLGVDTDGVRARCDDCSSAAADPPEPARLPGQRQGRLGRAAPPAPGGGLAGEHGTRRRPADDG